MSNLGLERALGARGIEFLRTRIGDRNVRATLKEHGGILGGEPSGHVMCLDKINTGDGLITALQVLAIMRRTGARAERTRCRDAAVAADARERGGR